MVQKIDALISITTTATRTEGGYPEVMPIKFCSDDSTSQTARCPYDYEKKYVFISGTIGFTLSICKQITTLLYMA